MSSDPAESRLVGRIDRCDAQSAKPCAGTPACDPRPATRVETSVRTLYTRDLPEVPSVRRRKYVHNCDTERSQTHTNAARVPQN
eukprot:4352147-Prymnesium_polylepis.1